MPLLTSPGIISIGLLAKGSGVNWTFIVLALVATGTIGGIVIYVDRLRTQKLEELARALGYTFRRKPTSADRELPIGCYLAETGRDPVISNVLEVARTDELDFVLFDYQYTVGYGKSQHSPQQTVARMRSPLLKMPVFLLFPETIFSKMAVMMGRTDINFPESPEFSDNYILRGGDEPALRAIFSPALQTALVPLKHLTIEGADDVLFIFRTERRIKPEELVTRIEEDKRILALLFEAQQAAAWSRRRGRSWTASRSPVGIVEHARAQQRGVRTASFFLRMPSEPTRS